MIDIFQSFILILQPEVAYWIALNQFTKVFIRYRRSRCLMLKPNAHCAPKEDLEPVYRTLPTPLFARPRKNERLRKPYLIDAMHFFFTRSLRGA